MTIVLKLRKHFGLAEDDWPWAANITHRQERSDDADPFKDTGVRFPALGYYLLSTLDINITRNSILRKTHTNKLQSIEYESTPCRYHWKYSNFEFGT